MRSSVPTLARAVAVFNGNHRIRWFAKCNGNPRMRWFPGEANPNGRKFQR